MLEIKLLELVPRPLFSHRVKVITHTKATGFKRLQKKSDSILFQFSTYCDPFTSAGFCDPLRIAGLTQKINFSFGQRWFLTFLKFSTYCCPCKCTSCTCESCRTPGSTQKRSFSVGEKRDIKFLQYSTSCDPCRIRLGCVRGNCVVDLNAEDACIPSNMLDLLRCGAIGSVRSIMSLKNIPGIPLRQVYIRAPISGMDKIIGVGLNYMDHCVEKNVQPPQVPMFFSKFSSTLMGPCDPLLLRHHLTHKVDWEVELCIVIGKTAVDVSEQCAFDYIIGCTVGQDITARDWQKDANAGQFLLGKSMDTFFPVGPYIVTLDEVGDINNLGIGCSINGCIQQCGHTSQLIHKIPTLIARLSSVMTLYPGDIIMTGTPAGVGANKKPQQFLYPGDVLYSWIDNVCSMYTFVQKFNPNKEPEVPCKPCIRLT